MVLDRPETPLNTNGSETDIRCYVTRAEGQRPEPAAMSAAIARCFSGSRQDLRQAWHRGLGLSGQRTQGGRAHRRPAARPLRQGAVPASLTGGGANTFAPIATFRCANYWKPLFEITNVCVLWGRIGLEFVLQ